MYSNACMLHNDVIVMSIGVQVYITVETLCGCWLVYLHVQSMVLSAALSVCVSSSV